MPFRVRIENETLKQFVQVASLSGHLRQDHRVQMPKRTLRNNSKRHLIRVSRRASSRSAGSKAQYFAQSDEAEPSSVRDKCGKVVLVLLLPPWIGLLSFLYVDNSSSIFSCEVASLGKRDCGPVTVR